MPRLTSHGVRTIMRMLTFTLLTFPFTSLGVPRPYSCFRPQIRPHSATFGQIRPHTTLLDCPLFFFALHFALQKLQRFRDAPWEKIVDLLTMNFVLDNLGGTHMLRKTPRLIRKYKGAT